jgi:hypothetical protein
LVLYKGGELEHWLVQGNVQFPPGTLVIDMRRPMPPS